MDEKYIERSYENGRLGGMCAAARAALRAGAPQEVMDVLLQMIEEQDKKMGWSE